MDAERARSEKEALRRRLAERRAALSPEERRRAAEQAAVHLFTSPVVQGCRTLMAYASIRDEVDTRPLIARAREHGMRIALPRVIRGERRMEAVWVDASDPLEPGAMGIPEPPRSRAPADPDELDLIIVPGLGFDLAGGRVGYGAGYYDRFLPLARRAVRVGLTYEACLVTRIPQTAHDQQVDWILTERGLRRAAADRKPPSCG